MPALHPRATLGVAALVAAAMALALTLALRATEAPSASGAPQLLMPLYAFNALGQTPVPPPPDNTAPAAPRLPDRGVMCFAADPRCEARSCIHFVAGRQVAGQCKPFARPKAHFHRVAVHAP